MFLPWHRIFTSIFEKDIQNILGNSSFALPYFDWGSVSSTWYEPSSVVFSASHFGTTGYNNNGCVPDGIVSNWTPYDGRNCLKRFSPPSSDPYNVVMYSESWMLSAITTNPSTGTAYTNWNDFSYLIDSFPHVSSIFFHLPFVIILIQTKNIGIFSCGCRIRRHNW